VAEVMEKERIARAEADGVIEIDFEQERDADDE
jgi:hypothetical protein